ncbi:MAG TPA: glutamine-hydrolyzing carbamoyl-phosphate synthase small subunit [Spirochaetota bacterium]|nr:glutamine-hydrolyzing carbamoyl-phosphate synthase small subunit [Spirochaetota bacterium]
MQKKGALALASGEYFSGLSFGADGEACGEVVFNTSMSGYQEIITDPSYFGQIVTMTYPEIGNYGVAEEAMESDRIQAGGLVVKHYSSCYSNFKAEKSLGRFLKEAGVVAIQDVDTRRLTRIIRDKGAQKAVISTADLDKESLVKKACQSPSIENVDLVKEVTTDKPYIYNKQSGGKARYRIAAYDFGIKLNILRCFAARDCEIKVFPASARPEEVLAYQPHGLFLSNGPGDPSAVPYVLDNVKALLHKLPVFGICFGHQILAQCLGASTYKLKFGHHGGNQPVRENASGRILITAENHGFAVKDLPPEVEVDRVNLNDQTIEGISHKKLPLFSIQCHPEASPGPHDSTHLFDMFIKMFREK